MPSRRRYIAALCSSTLFLSGCSSQNPDDGGPSQSRVQRHVTPTPPRDETGDDADTDDDTSGDEDPEADRLDVRDYGAEVDGETDDTHAVLDAIEAAEEGDTVYFPSGTTLVSDNATDERGAISIHSEHIPHNLTLQGEGRESVIRMADDQDESHSVIRLAGRESFGGLVIQHLQIDGNRGAQTGTLGHGILAYNDEGVGAPAHVRVRDAWFTDCSQAGISVFRGGFVIDRCTLTNCTIHGINIGNASGWDESLPPVVVRRCLCTENGKDGPGGTYGINCSGGNILVEDSVCANNGQGTKTTDGSINVTYRRVRLQNNDFYGYIRAGAETENRSTVTFDRVVASNNGEGGFRFSRDTDYRVPTDIIATGNGNINVVLTKNATLEAERVWANRANGSYGLRENSISGGFIREFYHYDNQSGAIDGGENLDISVVESRDRTDLASVPTVLEVGAGTTWARRNSAGIYRP